MENKEKKPRRQIKDAMRDEVLNKPWDGEYMGNIWGWKLSIIGGIVLALMVAWIIYAHLSTGTPFGMEEMELIEQPQPR
ncbi:MAG: hypothetical protein AB8G22_15645 [Saprospiraceae bacterium]